MAPGTMAEEVVNRTPLGATRSGNVNTGPTAALALARMSKDAKKGLSKWRNSFTIVANLGLRISQSLDSQSLVEVVKRGKEKMMKKKKPNSYS